MDATPHDKAVRKAAGFALGHIRCGMDRAEAVAKAVIEDDWSSYDRPPTIAETAARLERLIAEPDTSDELATLETAFQTWCGNLHSVLDLMEANRHTLARIRARLDA